MKQVLVLFSSALAVFGAVAGSSAPAGGEGWAKRAYLDPAFINLGFGMMSRHFGRLKHSVAGTGRDFLANKTTARR